MFLSGTEGRVTWTQLSPVKYCPRTLQEGGRGGNRERVGGGEGRGRGAIGRGLGEGKEGGGGQ